MQTEPAVSDGLESGAGEQEQEQERELCTQCLATNRPGIHFCHQCGAPLSSYAATGPFESLFAEGFVYRKAAEHPQRLIVVAGIWALFGMMASVGVLIAAFAFTGGETFIALLGMAMATLFALIIVKTTANYLRGGASRARVNVDAGSE